MFHERTSSGLAGEISLAPISIPAVKSRRSERIGLGLKGAMRRTGGSPVSVEILDLSLEGFRVETHLELEKGADIWVRLEGLDSRHAKVVWRQHATFGCAFVEALHPAVFGMIVRRKQA